MRKTWRVTKVTATKGATIAELVEVEWFKKNPAHVATMAEYDDMVERLGQEETDRVLAERADQGFIEEFLEAEPGEEGASFVEVAGRLTLDITDGLHLRPEDNVATTIDALGRS